VYCANCSHCIVFRQNIEGTNNYVLRVKCEKGMWKKKSGEEKIYKYFTIFRRIRKGCGYYDPMGDEREFLKDLKSSLPIKDEIYSYL